MRGVAVSLHLAHLRHDVGHGGIADGRQVERRPVAGHEVGQTLGDPQRVVPADQRLRDDVELEDVRQFVRDRAVEQVRRLVERQQHPVARRLGKRRDPLAHRARDDVLLLEIDVRLEDDQRHLERQVVLEVRADRLVGALGVAGHTLEVRLHLGVVVDLEVVRGVDLPVEIAVVDQVLPEIRNERRCRPLRLRRPGETADGHARRTATNAARHAPVVRPAHSIHLVRGGIYRRWHRAPCRILPARPPGRNRWLDLGQPSARVIPVASPVRIARNGSGGRCPLAGVLPPGRSARPPDDSGRFPRRRACERINAGGITRDLRGL